MLQSPKIPQAKLRRLFRAGDQAREEFRAQVGHRHHLFIPCDHREAYETLRGLRARAVSFVELGSGAGIVTILADLLGYEAYGIEIEPWLVERSIELAEQFGSNAIFAEGSFVPPAYQEETEHLAADQLTPTDGPRAYDELGLGLADFDLVFAYPWPGEEEWLFEMIRRFARPDALLLTYGSRDGFVVGANG